MLSKKNIYDISIALSEEMPCWPDSSGVQIKRVKKIEEGSIDNVSIIKMDIHAGTHIDAPWHFVKNGAKVESIDLQRLIGDALVVKILGTTRINADILSEVKIPKSTTRLLLRTDNSSLWEKPNNAFYEDFCALTPCAAQWIVDHKIEVIGIDYLSIQKYQDGPKTHQILLENEVIIIEGLNLIHVNPGLYELICMPIYIKNAEAAPARALLRDI